MESIFSRYHVVYETICRVNGKRYIGVHSTDSLDDGYLGSGSRLKRDIRKFGRTEFTRQVLSHHTTRSEALQEEARLVDAAWLNRPDVYNLYVGGGSNPRAGGTRVFSPEHREKLRLAQTGKKIGPMSEETKQKIGASNRGNSRPDLAEYNRKIKAGKTISWSPDAIMKRSMSLKEWYQTPEGIAARANLSVRMKENNPSQR